MDSFWPNSLDALNIQSPKEKLEIQAKFLNKLTNDMIYAEIIDLNKSLVIPIFNNCDFIYRFDIKGKFIDGYKFTPFTLGHSITFYPVIISIDREIASELLLDKKYQEINTEEEFDNIFKLILQSKKIITVIGSMLKLSN